MNPLQHRLAALRRRLHLVVSVRGLSWVIAIVLTAAAVGGLLDWRIHLPSLVRAVLLTGTLGGAGYMAYRYLIAPLRANSDDLSLALRIEEHYPQLNDALASAVQFLDEPPSSDRSNSPSLRKEAIQRALGQAEGFDFNPVVDTRGIREAGLSLLGSGALALILALLYPEQASTALLRLAHPFGSHEWPRQTLLEVMARHRVPRGEAYEIHGKLHGVVPDRLFVEYRLESQPALREAYEITRGSDDTTGEFIARLEPSRVQRSFRFQVKANDAQSAWQDVEVLPPPQLTFLDGKPSPRIHLQPPAYTDQTPVDLPDGTSSIETIAGTHVTLRAAVDRPIARAWLAYPEELQGPLQLVAAMGRHQLPPSLWRQIPAKLSDDGQLLTLEFLARLSGTFALHFEDELGLGSTRLIELRAVADPAPIVQLERPSRTQDSLDVLPDAEITLQVVAEDSIFALRSVYLEYRRKLGESPGAVSEPERLTLYDHEAAGRIIPVLHSVFGTSPLSMPPARMRLRPPRLEIGQRWSLKDLHLKEGDILILQACADDFDDETLLKKPGRSHEIEIRIVDRTALEIGLNQNQAQIQQELVRLQKHQQEALEKVIPAETHWRNQSQLQPKHLVELIQAEQLQQNIRNRVGTKQEGLRAEVAKVLQAVRDNHLPRSGTQDRMEAVQAELDRLAREELEQIEPRLTEARKESEAGAHKRSADQQAKSPLTEARKHQEEVNKTLNELLKLLEPWSSTHEVKGEARSILQDQRNLAKQTEDMARDLSGKDRNELKPEQQAELDKTEEFQKKLAERASQLLAKMDRLAKDKENQDPETSKQLKDAVSKGRDQENNAVGKMQQAAQDIRENQLSKAGNQQRDSARAMEEVVKALEDRREEELDKLIKKMKQAEKKLADLTDRQDQLQKKSREANQIADAAKRAEELKRLAREQEQLQRETQELLRELSRLRTERASNALSQAGSRMQQAGRQLQRGGEAEEQQDDALDRLDEARRELEQAREQAEEELARERLAKVADLIKALRDRQESLTGESARIQREVLQQKQWTRVLQSSQGNLSDNQKALSEETERMAREKMEGSKVFAHLLTKAAEAMARASDRMQERLKRDDAPAIDGADAGDGLNTKAENAADDEIQTLQRTALRRIDQLLDALKPEPGMSARAGNQRQGQQGRGGGDPKQKTGPAGEADNLPPMTQLKALRSLQMEVNDRTRSFHKNHPELSKLTSREKDQFQSITQEQQEITGLFQEITAPANAEGVKK